MCALSIVHCWVVPIGPPFYDQTLSPSPQWTHPAPRHGFGTLLGIAAPGQKAEVIHRGCSNLKLVVTPAAKTRRRTFSRYLTSWGGRQCHAPSLSYCPDSFVRCHADEI